MTRTGAPRHQRRQSLRSLGICRNLQGQNLQICRICRDNLQGQDDYKICRDRMIIICRDRMIIEQSSSLCRSFSRISRFLKPTRQNDSKRAHLTVFRQRNAATFRHSRQTQTNSPRLCLPLTLFPHFRLPGYRGFTTLPFYNYSRNFAAVIITSSRKSRSTHKPFQSASRMTRAPLCRVFPNFARFRSKT